MTQGYGPQDGQQGQWGPQGQEPQQQWGQPSPAPQAAPAAPQWGQQGQQSAPQASPAPQQWSQASPPPAPGGYPGSAGYQGAAGAGASAAAFGGAPSTVSKLVTWMFYAVLAVVAVRLIGNVIVFAIGFVGGAAGSPATVGAGNIFGLLVLLVNGLVTLALLVLAIMVIVQAKGRGRTGAIIVVATVVLAVIAYWILYGILIGVVASSVDFSTIGVVSLIYLIAEIIRCLIVFAALIVGGLMSRRWAKENA
jgi:hypothetical protein